MNTMKSMSSRGTVRDRVEFCQCYLGQWMIFSVWSGTAFNFLSTVLDSEEFSRRCPGEPRFYLALSKTAKNLLSAVEFMQCCLEKE